MRREKETDEQKRPSNYEVYSKLAPVMWTVHNLPLGHVVRFFLWCCWCCCCFNCLYVVNGFVLAVLIPCNTFHFFIRCLLANNYSFLFIVQFSPHFFFAIHSRKCKHLHLNCYFYARLCFFLLSLNGRVFSYCCCCCCGWCIVCSDAKKMNIFFCCCCLNCDTQMCEHKWMF